MIKCALLLISCLTIFAQRTPLSVNGTIVNNPNFTNTASVTWSVTGPNIRGTASAGSDSFWTNSSVASGSIQPVGGSNVYMPGTLAVVGQLTNDALQASQLVYSGPDKVLSSVSPGNSGDVLTSSGPGIAPSFLPVSGGDTIWTNDNGVVKIAYGFPTNAINIHTDSSVVLGRDKGSGLNGGLYRKNDVALGDPDFTDIFFQVFEDESDPNAHFAFYDIAISANPATPGMYQINTWSSNAVERAIVFNNTIDTSGGLGITMNYNGAAVTRLSPDGIDWLTAVPSTHYLMDTTSPVGSGNIAEVGNAGTNKLAVSWDGKATAVQGFSSTSTDAAVTIASTGWTNTFDKNAVVYMDGVGLTFTVYNNALTPVYTNSVSLVGASVLLQPSGKVIITDGTLGVGRATPF